MYYHCRPLKHVVYGKVYPPPEDKLDFMKAPYKWLGRHCGFYPQVWLSRSRSSITGIRVKNKDLKNMVLFGFEIIKGFGVDYNVWELLLNPLIAPVPFENLDKEITRSFRSIVREYKKMGVKIDDEVILKWSKSKNLNDFLNKCLFIESDQVVVPSLNLKSAKEIICSNERVKKALRKMGFIEDRIKIKNLKQEEW